MQTNTYSTPSAWCAAAILCCGLACAQEGARRAPAPVPEQRVLDLELSAVSDGVVAGLDRSLSGIGLALASLSDRTHTVLASLPPILAEIQEARFFAFDNGAKFHLRSWVEDYNVQFVVVDDASGLPSASMVVAIAARALDADG